MALLAEKERAHSRVSNQQPGPQSNTQVGSEQYVGKQWAASPQLGSNCPPRYPVKRMAPSSEVLGTACRIVHKRRRAPIPRAILTVLSKPRSRIAAITGSIGTSFIDASKTRNTMTRPLRARPTHTNVDVVSACLIAMSDPREMIVGSAEPHVAAAQGYIRLRKPATCRIVNHTRNPITTAALVVGAKPLLRFPVWLGRHFAGEITVRCMTEGSGRASNAKAKTELGILLSPSVLLTRARNMTMRRSTSLTLAHVLALGFCFGQKCSELEL